MPTRKKPPITEVELESVKNKVSFTPQPAVSVKPIALPAQPAVVPAPIVGQTVPVLKAPTPEMLIRISGVVDVMNDGGGFLRPKFIPATGDAYIASQIIRQWGVRPGDMVVGLMRSRRENEKHPALLKIETINGFDPALAKRRPNFSELTPIYAQKQVVLETDPLILSTRVLDLFAPIGFGQRGMVVSPPKAGKTTLLKEIAAGVAINHPKVHLMAVLVGERPEEVTDMQRFIKGEVIASSFDQKPEEQTKAAEIALERAKRLVEMGEDVFIIFDSITRLARAYNLAMPTSGRTLSGGFDPAALYPSKRFFGAARKIENGGSLTIIGTALVDTGSKMDELIFEEFKGTGNMEIRLERELAEIRKIYPAVNVLASGTRRDDLLMAPEVYNKIAQMRRAMDALMDKLQITEMILEQMKKTKNNTEFLAKFGKK
jgi:transcription termination factor Rho